MNPPRHTARILTFACAAALAGATPALAAKSTVVTSTPYAPRSGSAAAMTFTAIPANESGLTSVNSYDDPAMWGERYTEFSQGAIGSGIAAGDVDGDGLVDLFIANKTQPGVLYRQVAPFKFVDITAQAGVAGAPGRDGAGWKTGATFADVNNDGALDLYVCRFNAANLLYLNDGKGRFREVAAKAGVDLVSGSVVGAFEDYDRDGDLDLFVLANIRDAKRAPDGEPCRLYRNRGDATFEDVTAKAGILRDPSRGHSATWFDANDDGWADLYVANDFGPPDHLYRNNGDGTFTDILPVAMAHTTWFSMGADSADINNDGLADLFVAEMAGTTHYKSKVAMGDMGGLVDYMDTLVTPQYMKNAVFVNSGTDRFLEIAKMSGLGSTDWSWSPRFEDLDNDGWVDLHVTNGMVRPFIDSDMLNQIKKMTSPQQIIALVKGREPQRETNLAFRNTGDLGFKKVQADWGLAHTGVSFGSALADFDNDGDCDLVYVNFDDTVSLYRNDCPAAGRSVALRLVGTTSNRHGIGATVLARTSAGTQSRRLTVARGTLSSSEPVLHFGLGTDAAVSTIEIRWPGGAVQTLKNLAAGARYVVTEPASKSAPKPGPAVAARPVDEGLFADATAVTGLDFVRQERAFNDMVRQSLLPNRMNTLGGGLAWGDANGDGHDDVFFAGAAGQGCALYLNDGENHFVRSRVQQPWDDTIERECMAPLFLDVNGDGATDLLVTAGSVEAPAKDSPLYRSRLYLNDGSGRFRLAPESQFSLPPFSAAVAAAADFRRSGALGVFIGGRVVPGEYPTTPVSALLESRDGALVDVTDTACPALRSVGMVTAALWTDTDADGWLDLLVIGEWMSPRLFRNQHDGTFAEATEAAGFAAHTGWWNSLNAADLNGDGAIDYVAGNVGLNTKYHASPDHPVGIYYADIEGNGAPQVIESEYEGEKLFPVRGRSCSSRAMPSLKTKFPTFHDWGAALLPEIYGQEALACALSFKANELASGVFLNDGSGRFTFRAFPRAAQVSPIFGTAAADFDGDGRVDIVAVQNFDGPQVETGRFDGGLSLLLRGDGAGGFTAVPAPQSGIAIPGEGRGVTTTDLNRDGRPDLVLTRTNEPALVLLDRATTGRSFSVRLKNPAPGNPDAIGARVTVRLRDGSVQSREMYAGSGYLAQSEPLAFFSATDANPPVSVEVAWPDGSRSSQPIDAGSNRMVLTR